jgi:hypothetical protein
MAFKYPWEKEEKKEESKVELPKELEDRFSSVKTDVTTEVNKKIDERFSELAPVLEFAKSYKKDREDAEAARVEAARKKTEQENTTSDEDLAAELLNNPRKAISEATKGERALLLQVRADNIRREVFEDEASEYPYYTGDIKKEVNEMLAKQSIAFQNDRSSIANVYHTVVGKRMKEINEGKIKSRFASFSSTNSSGPNASESEAKKIKVTPEIERAAKLTGLTTKDYVDMLEKDEDFDYVG